MGWAKRSEVQPTDLYATTENTNRYTDPLIDDIQFIRQAISAEFHHDPNQRYAYYKRVEEALKVTGEYTLVGEEEDGVGGVEYRHSHLPSLKSLE